LPQGGGVVLVDKPAELTSHDVVAALRRMTGTRAVGHTGTLDPMATGLLLLCLGPATKLTPLFAGHTKEYVGTVRFGIVTDTLDATGEILEKKPLPEGLDEEAVRLAMERLTGEIEQIPPMASAVKVGGVRLHRLARKGIEVERRPRKVTVEVFELLGVGEDSADFRVVCSAGTYVRSLAAELGRILGVGGHLSELRRTSVGRFHVRDAWALEDLRALGREELLERCVVPAAEALDFLPYVVLEEGSLRALRRGAAVPGEAIVKWGEGEGAPARRIRVLDERGGLNAIGEATGFSADGRPVGVRPVRVLAVQGEVRA